MPSKITNGASSTLRRAGRRSASGSGGGGGGSSIMTTSQGNAIPPRSPAQLTQDALELLRQFLMYLDPASVRLLPIDEPPNAEIPIPISDWNVIYSTTQPTSVTSSIKVSSYPSSSKNLFCVQSVLPGVSTRQFWTLMAESGNRRLWDNTVQEGGNWRWLEEELGPNEAPLARSIAARIEYLRMGAIFMVAKPRDMLLLSADLRLPPTADSPLRMVSSCRSEVDPTKPPVKGYTRWDLGVGGFMVEELRGTDAIRVTQLSDLGELASWVPNSVVRMVASTMVPRSLSLISKAALKIQPHEAILGETAPSGALLRDEIVVKGHERWSRGRGLPGQIGKGPLQAREAGGAGTSATVPAHTPVESTSTASSSHAHDSVRSSSAFTATNSASSSSSPSTSSWKTPVNPNLLAPPLTLQRLSTRLHDLTPPNLSPSSHQARSVVSTDASSRGYGGSSNNSGGGDGEAASQQSSSPSHGSSVFHGQYKEGGNSDVDETVLVSDHQGADGSVASSQRGSFAGTQDDSGEDSLGHLQDARQLDERLQRFSMAVRATSTDEADGSAGQDAVENVGTNDSDAESDEAQTVLAEALSSSLQSPQLLPKLLPQSPHRRQRSGSANLTASSPPRSSSSASGAGAGTEPRSPTRRRMEKEASELSAMLLAGSDALVTALAPGARGIEELASGSSGPPSDDEGDASEVLQDQVLRARSGEGQEQTMITAPTTAAVSPASKTSALSNASSQVKAEPNRIPFKAWDVSFPPSSSSPIRPSIRRHASSNSSQPIVSMSSTHAMRSFSYSSRSSLAPPEVATASAGETAPDSVAPQHQQSGKRGYRSRPYALALGMMAMLWASSSSSKEQQQPHHLTKGEGAEGTVTGGEGADDLHSRRPQQVPTQLLEPGLDAQYEAAAAPGASGAAQDGPSPAITAARRALMQRSISSSSTTTSTSSSHYPTAATVLVPTPAPAAIAATAIDTPSSGVGGTSQQALPPPPLPSSSSLITPPSTLQRQHNLPPLPLSSPTFGASSWKSTSSKNTMTILPSPPASPRIPGEGDERRRLSRANYIGNSKLLTGGGAAGSGAPGGGAEGS